MTIHSMMDSAWHNQLLGDLAVAGLSERTREAYLRGQAFGRVLRWLLSRGGKRRSCA